MGLTSDAFTGCDGEQLPMFTALLESRQNCDHRLEPHKCVSPSAKTEQME